MAVSKLYQAKEQHHTIANYNARLTNTYGSPLKVT
jgi:hypothetical protein